MHEDLIGRLTFALEKQKAGAFSYLFSEAIAALSAQPDPGSGGERATQEMIDAGYDALLQFRSSGGDYSTHPHKATAAVIDAALAARQPVGQGRVEELRDALGKVRLRCMFIGWPAESMWEATPGNWIPDWRYELQLMEHVLHGSEIRTPEKPADTVPRNQLPHLVGMEPSTSLLATARRNIRQYISKASFASEVDRLAAQQCIDVLDSATAARLAPAAVPVDASAIVNAFDDITGLCRYLRQGGPDADDLQGLSDGLEEAIDIAAGMLARLSDPSGQPDSVTPQPAAASWRPIGEAVAGKLYVVGWRDPGDTETPDRHEFDYMADGEFWANHDDAVQHAEAVAPAGSEMPPQDAPYQWLIEIPALPSAERHFKPAGEASSNNQPETTP